MNINTLFRAYIIRSGGWLAYNNSMYGGVLGQVEIRRANQVTIVPADGVVAATNFN